MMNAFFSVPAAAKATKARNTTCPEETENRITTGYGTISRIHLTGFIVLERLRLLWLYALGTAGLYVIR